LVDYVGGIILEILSANTSQKNFYHEVPDVSTTHCGHHQWQVQVEAVQWLIYHGRERNASKFQCFLFV